MAPEISNCCGFSLKHGTIIIGIIQSILSFMCLVLSAAYAEHPQELVNMSDPSIVPDLSSKRETFGGFTEVWKWYFFTRYYHFISKLFALIAAGILMKVLKCLLIIICVASAIHFVFSIFLIFGAETNRPLLLLPWLIYYPIAVIVYILLVLVAIVHHAGDNTTAFVIGHLTVGAVMTMIAFYKIIAVHSFFKHLKSLNF